MDNLINSKVKHSEFGAGIVKDANDEWIAVEFDVGVRFFPFPDAIINNYLIFDYDIKDDKPKVVDKDVKKAPLDNKYYRNLYREEFRKWIDNTYNKKTNNPINDSSGYASDAFYIEKYCTQRDFLTWFESEESLEEAREALLKVPNIVNGKEKPSSRVSGYIAIMRLFKKFLIDIGKL